MKSIKEIYKVGKGPSSSHTMGPERAAQLFKDKYPQADAFKVVLYGSLSKTGVGHGTDRVIRQILAPLPTEIVFSEEHLEGFHPNTMDFFALKEGAEIGTLRVESVDAVTDATDWDLVYSKYDEVLHGDIKKLNTPTITDKVDPAKLKECWPQIRQIILETLPSDEELMAKMLAAGAAVTPEEVHVPPQLLEDALRFHPYMRYRMLLTRVMPMLQMDIVDYLA